MRGAAVAALVAFVSVVLLARDASAAPRMLSGPDLASPSSSSSKFSLLGGAGGGPDGASRCANAVENIWEVKLLAPLP